MTHWFTRVDLAYAALATGCLLLWCVLRCTWARTRWAALVLGVCAVAEVTAAGYDVNVQSPPELYYPHVPVLDRLAQLPPGRICGCRSFPASLNMVNGIRDVRGFDAVDPARMVELMKLFPSTEAPTPSSYAALQRWFPTVPHGLVDLLGLRYFLIFGPPTSSAMFQDGGFWIREYSRALPRPFFARRGEIVNDKAERLKRLSSRAFDPREVVYLESNEPLPFDALPAAGKARITIDEPEHVAIALEVSASGWLVLSDRWTDGWKARVDGQEQSILCADHAFRAVHVEPGMKDLDFRYEPRSWRLGWMAALLAVVLGSAWIPFVRRTHRS